MRHPLYQPKPKKHYEITKRIGKNVFLKDYEGILFFDKVNIMFGENQIQSGVVANKESKFSQEGLELICYQKTGWSEQIDNRSILIFKA